MEIDFGQLVVAPSKTLKGGALASSSEPFLRRFHAELLLQMRCHPARLFDQFGIRMLSVTPKNRCFREISLRCLSKC